MSDHLDDRLALLGVHAHGDWDDVCRRADALAQDRPAISRRAVLVLAFAVLAFLAAIPALGLGSRLRDLFSVSSEQPRDLPAAPDRQAAGSAAPGLTYVYGDELHLARGGTQQLGARAFGPLRGPTRLAVPSPDGRYVAYATGAHETPSLRVHDVQTGDDRLLARSAQGIAWSATGRIAYWVASRPRYSGSGAYLGHIVVRRSLDTRPVRWTTVAGEYDPVAWAGDRLIVSSHVCAFPECNHVPRNGLYALDGPGRMTPLPLQSFTALSPDGRYVIGGWKPNPTSDASYPFVRVVAVRSGRVVAHVDLRRLAHGNMRPRWFEGGLGNGAWVGDRIVAETFGSISALAFLRFDGRRLSIDDVLRLDRAPGLDLGEGPWLYDPIFLDAAGRRVTFEARASSLDEKKHTTLFLTCDRVTRRCSRGRSLPPRRWLALVWNPSRPFPDLGLTAGR